MPAKSDCHVMMCAVSFSFILDVLNRCPLLFHHDSSYLETQLGTTSAASPGPYLPCFFLIKTLFLLRKQ